MKPDFYLHKYGWSSAVFLVSSSSSSFIFCLRTKPLPTLKVHWCLHCFREKICKKFWNGSFSSFYTHRDVWNKGFFSARVWGYMCCFRTNDVWCNLSSYNGNSCIRPMIHRFQSNFRLAHLILMSIFWEKRNYTQFTTEETANHVHYLTRPRPHSWERWDACPGLLTWNPLHSLWLHSCWVNSKGDLAYFYLRFKYIACLWPPFPSESCQLVLSQNGFHSLALSLFLQRIFWVRKELSRHAVQCNISTVWLAVQPNWTAALMENPHPYMSSCVQICCPKTMTTIRGIL